MAHCHSSQLPACPGSTSVPPIASQAVPFSKPGHIMPLGWLLTELTRETKVLTRPTGPPRPGFRSPPRLCQPLSPHSPCSGHPGVSPVSKRADYALVSGPLSTASRHSGLRGPSQITFLQTVLLPSRKVTHQSPWIFKSPFRFLELPCSLRLSFTARHPRPGGGREGRDRGLPCSQLSWLLRRTLHMVGTQHAPAFT